MLTGDDSSQSSADGMFNTEAVEKLKHHPLTENFFSDPEFVENLEELAKNPAKLAEIMKKDPRFLKVL